MTIDDDVADQLDSATCYVYPELAINIDNDIDSVGSCGDGGALISGPLWSVLLSINFAFANSWKYPDGDYRCDDGQCCSDSGYCGPEWNGLNYVNYDSTSDGSYDSAAAAFAAYCPDARLGDWRMDDCSGANRLSFAAAIQTAAVAMALFVLGWNVR